VSTVKKERYANDPDCPKCRGTGIEEEHSIIPGSFTVCKACDCFKLRTVEVPS